MTATNLDWAVAYVSRQKFALAPVSVGLKHPNGFRWNQRENLVSSTAAATAHWTQHPRDGMACVLDYSGERGLVTWDIDDPARAEELLANWGFDLPMCKTSFPCIVGQNYKFVFQKPVGIEIKHRTYAEPNKHDPQRMSVVFELRTGPRSDTLPPTVHPKTGKPYYWLNSPRDGIPPVPKKLLEIWLNWDEFRREALALCPWAPPPKPLSATESKVREARRDSVIDAFNAAHDAASILEAHGYERRGKRFASPGASHDAGIVELENGKLFCHHAGDPLHSEHAHDCFDLYRVLEHGGDYRAAVKAAAEALGLSQAPR